jgi:cell division protein DivIC
MENNFINTNSSKPPQRQGGFGKFSWLKNKYLLAGTFFIVWMFFFDPKDWGVAFEKNAKLKELQNSELHLSKTIMETRKELDQLKSNAQTIEKYAREKYLMKKDNEDLFIVSSAATSK